MIFVCIYAVGLILTALGMALWRVDRFGDSPGEFVDGAGWGLIGGIIWPVLLIVAVFAALAKGISAVIWR